MKNVTALLFGLALVGCATQPAFDYDPDGISNIGILILVEDKLTHSHVGTTVFNNSVESYPAQTISPSDVLARRTTETLESQGYKVTAVNLPADFEYSGNSLVSMRWSDYAVRSRYREPLESLLTKHDIDLLLVFESFARQDNIGGTSVHIEGYGLYTRAFFGNQFARVYANVWGYGIYKNPVAFVAAGGTSSVLKSDVPEINSETAPEIEEKIEFLFEDIVQDVLSTLKL